MTKVSRDDFEVRVVEADGVRFKAVFDVSGGYGNEQMRADEVEYTLSTHDKDVLDLFFQNCGYEEA